MLKVFEVGERGTGRGSEDNKAGHVNSTACVKEETRKSK